MEIKVMENEQIVHLLKRNKILEEKYNNLKSKFVRNKFTNDVNYDLINAAYTLLKLDNNKDTNSIKEEENDQYTYESMVEAYKNADYSSFMVSEFM